MSCANAASPSVAAAVWGPARPKIHVQPCPSMSIHVREMMAHHHLACSMLPQAPASHPMAPFHSHTPFCLSSVAIPIVPIPRFLSFDCIINNWAHPPAFPPTPRIASVCFLFLAPSVSSSSTLPVCSVHCCFPTRTFRPKTTIASHIRTWLAHSLTRFSLFAFLPCCCQRLSACMQNIDTAAYYLASSHLLCSLRPPLFFLLVLFR